MLNWIISFSLRNRLFVLIAALLVSLYGAYLATTMPIDVLPDLNRPTVTVMTEAHSMVPEDVERLITLPLEQTLNGATGVVRVRSQSGMGLSVVFVEFDWGTDIYRNRQIVQEKLQLASAQLPPDASPYMAPISSIMGQIQLIGVQSRSDRDVTELRALAEYDIKYRLLAIPGIAKIICTGSTPRQLQIIMDTEKLRTFNVTLEEVAEAVQASNLTSSGGFMNLGSKAPMMTVTGLVKVESEVADAVVKPDPVRPVRVRDIAEVRFGPAAIRTGEAGIDGERGVVLVVYKQPKVDTVRITEQVNQELEAIQEVLPEDISITPDLFQQASFIRRAIDNVFHSVRDGSIMVVIVLFLFLLNFRTTFITLTSIPLSIAITALIFTAFDLSINTMTLGGLAVAIGALVDDAIVGVENVFRRLRQNAAAAEKHDPLWVIFTASSEVRKPVLIGTLLVIVVFLPLFFLTGLEGTLFTPVGIAYILSVSASLLVSLTVAPALCFYLLRGKASGSRTGDSWLVRRLKVLTGRLIRLSLNYPLAITGLFIAVFIVALMMLMTRGTQFLPEFNEGALQANIVLPPETGIKTSDAFGQRLEKLIHEVKGVKHVARLTGRAEGDEHAHAVNYNQAIISLDHEEPRPRAEILRDIREKMEIEFPGVARSVEQPLDHLLSHMLSGVQAQVAIKIFGPDLAVLRGIAAEVEDAVRPVPGVKDLFTEPQVLVDHIRIHPDREQLARYGLGVEDVTETIELAFEGEKISEMQIDLYKYPIVVRLKESDRRNLDSIRNLYLRRPDGGRLLLSDVARVELTKTPNNINKENALRRIVVQHNVADRSLGEVVRDVREKLQPIRERLAGLTGYSIRISGQFEAQAAAAQRITILSIFSLLLMALILYLHFKSVNFTVQVLLSIPMAFIGAVGYIMLSGQILSVSTLVGLISLGGIAARNAILLLDHYLNLMRKEGETFGPEMIVRAGQERMVPVMMTALTSGIALVPIALYPDTPGREILYPVATVIIGGLISSTLLDFLVRPALFSLFGRKEAERLAAEKRPMDRVSEELARELTRKDRIDSNLPEPKEG
ncbi:MAG: efflux RND transporter permease subunit, partial [Planctomycetota bacterium]